ncbi:glutathione S-transferase family protein [Polymorphobacter fuscus]|uniref:Glutathione S-transferase n=1 Tax=Sandarakinorhabdus fusca TaxID=1439888 RepID=A0A7C9KNR0_9SPHN|nr:glutathione S-transferase family protein [Polymorphobacter fuscus]KAB7643621.1 glutathione S-transferase family protein [Polymorphobacter fuscus]MQT18703.1 glutathione S-transferase [Polymorphobacter fuscus]NJC09589.1 glutathione S-transferase [Polymorphobacter fuscus]
MDLILYTNPQSRGRTARFMLEEVGVPYETVILDYEGAMKTPEYLAINPMGKVPALRHGDQTVTECAAICAYLADAFPDAGLAPPPARRGDYYRWLFFAAGPVEAAIMDRYRKLEPDDEQQRMLGYGDFDRTIAAIDAAVTRHPWLAGDDFSAADVYAGSQIDWPMQFGMLTPTPALSDYVERLRARPAYVRANAIDG